MESPYVGQILAVGFNFAPLGWALCNGQLLPISQNTALFSLIGTFYGGNGTSNFALPNLQSRVPLHFGQGLGLSSYDLGEETGVETVTLTTGQMPAHTHPVMGFALRGDVTNPSGATWARSQTGDTPYATAATSGQQMNPQTIGLTGGNQPHENRMPFLAVNFIIALQGIYPERS